jgi:hypothetical protein
MSQRAPTGFEGDLVDALDASLDCLVEAAKLVDQSGDSGQWESIAFIAGEIGSLIARVRVANI